MSMKNLQYDLGNRSMIEFSSQALGTWSVYDNYKTTKMNEMTETDASVGLLLATGQNAEENIYLFLINWVGRPYGKI